MIEVIPSILTNDQAELEDLISLCEGKVERAHIDIIDGVFANNRTIEPSSLESIESELKFGYHLMVLDPIKWVERCVKGFAQRIIGHVEKMPSQIDFVGKVSEVGAEVGLAIDLGTPVTKIDSTILTNLDVVVVMSVQAGFGGQKFDSGVVKKVRKLDELRKGDDTPYRICVDGGMNEKSIEKVEKAGANEVAIGRLLFEGNFEKNVKRFQ